MIVVRFKVRCRPDMTERSLAAFRGAIAPSRAVDGVVSFDIARDLADPDAIIAIEVFEDRAALERQESLPAVQAIIDQLGEWVAAPPEATIFHVSGSEPHGAWDLGSGRRPRGRIRRDGMRCEHSRARGGTTWLRRRLTST